MAQAVVGQPVLRVDGVEKVTGAALYAADLRLPGMLHAKVLRSPHPHARIVSVDVGEALKLPGVVAAVTGRDLETLGGEAVRDMPFLARERVRYAGEPVAAVAATEESIAEEALKLIKVTYQELPAVYDPVLAAREDAPLLHERVESYQRIGAVKPVPGTNVINFSEDKQGDVERGFAEADYVFADTFRMHTVQHGQIEPHCSVAQWGLDGRLTVWTSNDGPHRLRKDLSDALGLPLTRIRVIVPYLGGGYGGKGGLKAEPIAIALARKIPGRPVRLVLTREEVFTATLVRHAAVITVKTGVKADGTLVAREVIGYWDTGAYAEKGPTVVKQSTAAAAGPYRVPNIRLVGNCVYTNRVPAGAYRGYGTPQVTWAYESQMDLIAHRMRLDPLEFRLKNVLREGDRLPTGQPAHGVGIEECLRRVAAELKWGEKPGPGRGKGIACTAKNTKTPSGSAAYVSFNQDGTAGVLTSSVEIGQGVRTIMAQIAAEELGVPVERVNVSFPDTDTTPFDASTTSSRTTFHMGNAVRAAARNVKEQLAQLAAFNWNCAPEDVSVGEGRVSLRDDPGKSLTYHALLRGCYGAGGSVLGNGFYYPRADEDGGMWSAPSVFWMYGAQGAEVEVDQETGQVRVLKLVAAHDVGRAINPVTCSGQIEGGAVHGLGTSVYEEVIVENGRVLNANFHDYKLPTAMDLPEVVPIIVEAAHKDGPYGAKGVGEPVLAPTAPAIANAVEAATGVRIQELPLTPERVFQALRRARG
ncbi:MAG: xanthine dehydrogenase family protein molybdopterin-binding subunit [Actinobacteria bacterium]|nr:xanthine dehydrogenase family protein molybdopterin-binding subunit [Actinomycetota bacterium]